MIWVESC